MNVLVPDEEVSRQYGKVKAQLKRNGTPIPENDIWIAATAIAGKLTLITADSDRRTAVRNDVKTIISATQPTVCLK